MRSNALGNRSHDNLKLIAMADAFAEPISAAHQSLKDQFHAKVDVPPDRRFVGLDAYEKAIAAGADIVMLCTPPGFRPAHFTAAVKAGKQVFLEKPVAVDAPGYRAVKIANADARKKGLHVAVGHHLRHARNHVQVVDQIHDGLIGDLLFTRTYFNTQGIWNRPRQPGMTEMQYQVNNWYHFVWLSGDHNVEQHVHGIDACNWIAQAAPVQATGIGGRQVRARAGHRRDFRSSLRSVHLRRRLVQLQRMPSAAPAPGPTSAIMPTGGRAMSTSTATTGWSFTCWAPNRSGSSPAATDIKPNGMT